MAFLSCLLACMIMCTLTDLAFSAAPSVKPTNCTKTSQKGYWCPDDADTVSTKYYYYCSGSKGSWKTCASKFAFRLYDTFSANNVCSDPGQHSTIPCVPEDSICDRRVGYWCATDATHGNSYYYRCITNTKPV